MVMPLYDHSPFRWQEPPFVTWGLIAINVAVFVLQAVAGGPDVGERIDHFAAVIPAAFSVEGAVDEALPPPLTLITYTFLHASFLHVLGNMVFLWVFGDDIEAALGHWRYLAFYLACGAGSAIVFVLSDPHSQIELIGASGAVAGVIAAYLMYRPCARVTVWFSVLILRVAAYWVLGGWALWQVIEAAVRADNGVAYWAHVGGLLTGAALFLVIRPPGVELFECVQPDKVRVTGAGESR